MIGVPEMLPFEKNEEVVVVKVLKGKDLIKQHVTNDV